MATSGSYNYKASGAAIVAEAFRKIGALGDTETLDTTRQAIGLIGLNLMVKTFTAFGLEIWTLQEELIYMSLFGTEPMLLVGPGQAIDLDYRPVKLLECQRGDDSTATDPKTVPMIITPNRTWQEEPNKKMTGVPNSAYYKPNAYTGELHIWPVPDTYWAANGYVQCLFQRQVQDFDSSSDDPDFPPEWHEALVYQLAVRLAPNYGLAPNDRAQLEKTADKILGLVLSNDQEEGSIYLRPHKQ